MTILVHVIKFHYDNIINRPPCRNRYGQSVMGRVAQSVTCLTADKCPTADPGVMSLTQAWSHTFMEIDHEIISTAILLPSADSISIVVSYKQKYLHKVNTG